MAYEFRLSSDAEKQLHGLERQLAKRILKKIAWIAQQKNPMRHAIPLHHPKIGDVRFRVGDYRVIAVLDTEPDVVMIVAIGHRRDVYR
ncbi:type II toxin-antitoxin system RelE/ParE family toxin [Patescibacteria group bacterium]|nr:type II toxin-antitoxin system RelE/ParE family toxin [Patescibacteria group bacterium]MBU1034515.1 type II toxin-antitoxin system RelE/ParE family toxin [Patescibacteria group bacterium]MBU1629505.1 type II toxin-antitoxin system RelE/ParE family toxin [Patescibacteria group bacterium]MBU1907865.1 type II toxin-antitoxin system RelE/ParE family toxin [Patescibacteria group bacterium]